MTDERIAEQNSDEVVEKKSFLSWVKEHKTQLLLAGISVTTILAAAIGLKNFFLMVSIACCIFFSRSSSTCS